MAIIVAIVCGTIIGISKFEEKKFRKCLAQSPLLVREPTAEDITYLEKWQRDNAVIIDPNCYRIIDPSVELGGNAIGSKHELHMRELPERIRRFLDKLPYDQTLKTVCEGYLEDCYWKNISKAKIAGIAILHGFGFAIASYAGVWCIWLIGLGIFLLVKWLCLGFCDGEKNNE